MKSQYLKDLTEENVDVDSLFAIKDKQGVKTYINGFMFTFTISDKTQEMIVNYFGSNTESEVKGIHQIFEEQDVIHLKGKTNKWQGKINIIVKPESGSIEKTENYDLNDFAPMTSKNIPTMVTEFKEIISNVTNSDIKRLLDSIFNQDDFMEKYSKAAAASSNHHNFGGGLIEHVLSMIKISIKVVEMHPELDKDLLIVGCIFHDIGKVNELKVGTSVMYTTEGNLLGHISMGQKMVNDWIDGLEDFPDLLKQKILHMILSHHGKQEWGSPVTPLFPEATALHYVDNLDSSIQNVIQQKEKANPADKWIKSYNGYPKMFLE